MLFVGYKNIGTFISSYLDNQTSGKFTSAGGSGVVGKNTTQM